MWGEDGAGRDWHATCTAALTEIGWTPDEAVPCLWYFNGPESDARLLTVVDDFLISDSFGYDVAEATVQALIVRFKEVTHEREPSNFIGYKIDRDRERRALTLSMPQKIEDAVQKYLPDSVNPKASRPLPCVHADLKAIEAFADNLRLEPSAKGPQKLSKQAKRNQRAIGDMKFFEKVMPAISLPVHRLSCIMSNPDGDSATKVVDHILMYAYAHRHEGITFGGGGLGSAARLEASLTADVDLNSPAPKELEVYADATWSLFNIYGLLVTYYGAAVFHQTKRIAMICDCSQKSEAVATSKAGEIATYAREVQRALGIAPRGPTFVGTDNKANMLVARNQGSAARSKHFLRQYTTLRQRQAEQEIVIGHVPDENMPADFLTKWTSKEKLQRSLIFATNRRASCGAAPDKG